ncbi:hypothetical protein PQJ75_23535 [Rhodoplanes sp. TEM]|uniref:Polymerase/histidinol phosphatase N-terminal domain-containing protein n=1 Tax=Rhodoplanes tepidamans TaxID=200616 RepID=A0ABT5JH60_RHOTP|nr:MULTISPECIES: hypothetical protein [Rhodoplanes]MDC7788857.1 hypothetical protein [Rhodoplanes tepidamans]MDC7986712.1 hypothetical protein [Rhodoplanes sp. TEM]MDQ0357834.1 hypothetical protein [Rhodoplanes tepidamans]
MKSGTLSRQVFAGASVLAVAAGAVVPTTPSVADSYMAGDFHNHTPCSDGRSSVETMVTKAVQSYGLEWLGAADHGGSSPRDCRVDDPEGDGSTTGLGKYFDEEQGSIPAMTIYGNTATSQGHRSMWRWQSVEEIVYPELARLAQQLNKPMLYAGVETNVPGHEHTSMAVIGNQKPENFGGDVGNASAVAEFEYRFDRSDTDTQLGAPNHNWTGKVANASGTGSGTANHNNKAVPSVAWLQANYPLDSYYVPAHVERAGVFNANGNNGFNVEHFRDFNNAGPTVAVGFETMPGHQASNNRGEYRAGFCGTGCDSVGVTTYGGTGIYGAKIGGLWDALLGEGRNWFFYASSDWHNRGAFSIYEAGSTNDFYPGEYQKLYIPRPANGTTLRPQVVVDAVRSGNSYSVAGDLITGELTYKAEVVGYAAAGTAKMGQTLVVPRGRSVRITLEVNVPTGTNHSPYSFNNPSLAQLQIQEPLNRPTLRFVQFIKGNVTGVIPTTSSSYTNATNSTAGVAATFNSSNWTASGQKRTMTFTISNVQNNMYVRARGSNLPPGTPNETDNLGNPLNDWDPENSAQSGFVPCTDPACPDHMAVRDGVKVSSYDVAGWSDLWFYTNPIFIRVSGQPQLLVETNAAKAAALK